jgi:hypothetical protein
LVDKKYVDSMTSGGMKSFFFTFLGWFCWQRNL